MYGLVNQAIQDLVISKAGETTWNGIRNKVGFKETQFTPMKSYPDALTYQLVGAVSEALSLPAPDVLQAFGEYWVLYTAQKGYGEMLDFYLGKSLHQSLSNLNQLHTRLGMLMPNLNPPRFVVREDSKNEIVLEYHSTRDGLAPMVVGLLQGLSKRFNEPIDVKHEPKSATQSFDLFIVQFRG